jgi:uncharacterized membrane protein HdeD (DUF308 family)
VQTVNLEAHLQEGEQLLSHIWRATLLRGLLGIAFAVVILVWPGIGLTTLTALFGAYALVSGGASVGGAFKTSMPAGDRAWLVLGGLGGIAVGVLVFAWPGLSALALLYVIAAWAIASGVLELSLAFGLPAGGERRLLLALSGLLSMAFGVVMFARPGAGAVALLALIAAFAFVTGVVQVVYAVELGKATSDLKQRFRLHPQPRRATHGPAVRGT